MAYKDPEVRKIKSAERAKRWSQANPEKAAANARAWRLRNQEHMIWLTAKRRADRTGIDFDIDVADIEIPKTCPVACVPIFPRNDGKRGPCDNSPTLDRVNPEKGYVKGNVRVLSHRGNRWKNEMTVEDVKRLLEYMCS